MTKSVQIFLFSLLVIFPCYGDIAGDISIGKSEDTAKGNIKIGYDFEMGDITLIPFIDYISYFKIDGTNGHPFRDIFGCGVKVEYKDVYLLVRHECVHEVSSVNSRNNPVLYNDAIPNSAVTFVTIGYRWGKEF